MGEFFLYSRKIGEELHADLEIFSFTELLFIVRNASVFVEDGKNLIEMLTIDKAEWPPEGLRLVHYLH